MPRITHLIAEIGTTGTTGQVNVQQSAAAAVADAVWLEHPCEDTSCTCGVAAALDAGYPFSAAHLLVGATETPLLDAVLAYFRLDQRDWPADWDEWVEYHKQHGRQCPSCGTFTYDEDRYTCGNCLGNLS